MNRISIVDSLNKVKTGDYFIDGLNILTNNLTIETESCSVCDIFVKDFSKIEQLNIIVNTDSQVTLSILGEEEILKHKIKIKVLKNATFNGYLADFTKKNNDFNCLIELAEESANGMFKVASLASLDDRKKIDISLVHHHPKTIGKIDCFGVCKDKSKLTFLGTSHIVKGAIKSKTQQSAKVVVFDPESNAVAKPILKIDENEIEASHAAVIGRINDEHLFYLTSRGLSEAEAKDLITLGYLKPILVGFKEEEIKKRISSLIEGRA